MQPLLSLALRPLLLECVCSKLEESIRYINEEVQVFPLWVCVVKATLNAFKITDVGAEDRTSGKVTHIVDVGALMYPVLPPPPRHEAPTSSSSAGPAQPVPVPTSRDRRLYHGPWR